MFDLRAMAAPMVFGLGYLASIYLLETAGEPDHAKFAQEAMGHLARRIAESYL